MPRENLEKTVKIEFSPNYFTKTTYFEPNGEEWVVKCDFAHTYQVSRENVD